MRIASGTQAKMGQRGIVSWTNSHNYYQGKAEIVKINLHTIRVRLLESVDGYPKGQILLIPLQFNRLYSANNCFETD